MNCYFSSRHNRESGLSGCQKMWRRDKQLDFTYSTSETARDLSLFNHLELSDESAVKVAF